MGNTLEIEGPIVAAKMDRNKVEYTVPRLCRVRMRFQALEVGAYVWALIHYQCLKNKESGRETVNLLT